MKGHLNINCSERKRYARRIQVVFLPLLLLVLALTLRADSAVLPAKRDCGGPGLNRWVDEYGWQTLAFNLELHFTLQGTFPQQSGDPSLFQAVEQ